ncbi:unnamed protein product [Moneuplotes crassus]|uniref:methionine--tRNA ligase n=1 Tax=Euplotes crassus TaxID=5936 RepID=A0AAD1UB16_EUPCR|nr:unnamed protein product [Moneuplotes crassus]
MKSLITTPIFYTNGTPHIGHLYTLILADAVRAWKRICGHQTRLMTGTDEHGIKIQKKAKALGITPLQLCDKNSQLFRKLTAEAGIKADDFIRTTEERHHNTVKQIWTELHKRNYLEVGNHEGYYSVNDECFYVEKDLTAKENEDTNQIEYFTELGEKVNWITEQNYLFKFDDNIKKNVHDWINSDTNPISPEYMKNLMLKSLTESKSHLSVSRPKSRVKWGIDIPKIPGDIIKSDQTVYVWLDALFNYKTVNDGFGDFNGELVHIIGKDIAKFHCIYWPAFLSAAELDLPKKVIVHGHWTKDNLKMSKSIGNVVDPFDIIKENGINAVRSYLLSYGPQSSDSNFEVEKLVNFHDSVIIDGFINMFFRLTGKKVLDKLHIQLADIEFTPEDRELIENAKNYTQECIRELNDLNFSMNSIQGNALKSLIDLGNWYLNHNEFWRVKCEKRLSTIRYVIFELTRIISTILYPYCPEISTNILECLNVPTSEMTIKSLEEPFTRERFDINKEKRLKLFFKKINPKVK